ncbi:MAG: hypothetical protein LBJ59_10065 [Zoogloeaceae bacterium]|jgi:hypothetical protein|nr:hypothetical protein [Zoogloeaceae bacterium]
MSVFSPRRSWRWFCATFRLFAQRSFLLLTAMMCFFLLALEIRHAPYVGHLLPHLLWACLVVSMANLALSPRPSLMDVVRPVRERFLPLAGLALLLLCYAALALRLLTQIDPEFIYGLLQRNPDFLRMGGEEYRAPALRLLLLFIPFFMAQWFTPMLIVWRRYSIGKALFFNFVAIGRNWRDVLLVFLMFNALTLGLFFLIALFPIVNVNLSASLAGFIMIIGSALHLCFLCVLYQDFFPAEKRAHISEHA